MKKIITTFFKLLEVAFDCLIGYPLLYTFIVILPGLWDFDLKSKHKTWLEMPYKDDYKTPYDYLVGKKLKRRKGW